MKKITTTTSPTEMAQEQGWHCNTDPCVDVKTLLRSDRRAKLSKNYMGVLTRDSEEHYTFVEESEKAKTAKRTPVIFRGECVNVHLLGEKAKRLAFTQPLLDTSLSFHNFCLKAAQELLMIARLLGREEGGEWPCREEE